MKIKLSCGKVNRSIVYSACSAINACFLMGIYLFIHSYSMTNKAPIQRYDKINKQAKRCIIIFLTNGTQN